MTAITEKLGTNYWGMYFDPAKFDFETFKSHWDYDLSMIKQMPMDWLRIGYTYYDGGLNADGSYNFERLDYAIDTAQSSGLKIILPIWFVDDGLTNKTNIDYQSYYAKWIDMIEKIVQRYAGKGIYYEAIDEATSGGHFWLNQNITDSILNDIVSMNTKFYNFIQKYDDSAVFINGDFASPSAATFSAIDKGMLDFGEYASYHPYFANPEGMISDSTQIKLRSAIYNKGLPMSATEFGFGSPSAFNGSNTPEQKASKLLRQIYILDMLNFEHIIQFTMDGSDVTWILQNTDGTFNLSGQMIKSQMTELTGYTFQERIKSDTNDYLFKYVKNGFKDKVVYWTTSSSHVVGKYTLTDTPQIYTLDYITKYENTKIWTVGDEVTTETMNNIENSIYDLGKTVEELQLQPTEKSNNRVPLLSNDNFFTGVNNFDKPINGSLLTRPATFTDFSQITTNMVKYAGNWDVQGVIVTGNPLQSNVVVDHYYIVSVIPTYAAITGGTITVSVYSLGKSDVYVSNVSRGKLNGWFKLPNDQGVVHKIGNETIAGDKTFTGYNNFTQNINGALKARTATFTDFATIASDTIKYAGNWYTAGNAIANGPTDNWNWSTIEVLGGYGSGSGIIRTASFWGNQEYVTTVNSGKIVGWKPVANDSKVVHNTGTETIDGNKTFTGTVSANNLVSNSIPVNVTKTTTFNSWFSSTTTVSRSGNTVTIVNNKPNTGTIANTTTSLESIPVGYRPSTTVSYPAIFGSSIKGELQINKNGTFTALSNINDQYRVTATYVTSDEWPV